MPKMKTNRAAAKRFKKTGSGRIVHYRAYKRHILTKKSSSRKRKLRGGKLMRKEDEQIVRRLIPYL